MCASFLTPLPVPIHNIKRTHTSASAFLGLPRCSYFSTCEILSKQTEEHMIQGSQADGLASAF